MLQSSIFQLNQNTFSPEWVRQNLLLNINQDYSSIKCSICQQIALNPCECDTCECLFCEKCINEYLESNKHCYQDCQAFQKRRAHKTIREIINSLSINCVNKDKGCKKQLKLEQLELHRKNSCEFLLIECKNKKDGCSFSDIKQKVLEHEQSCEYTQLVCQNCQELYIINENHNCVSVLAKKVLKLEELQAQLFEKLKLDKQEVSILDKLSQKFEDLSLKLDKKNQIVNHLCHVQNKHQCDKFHDLQWGRIEGKNCKQCGSKKTNRFICAKCCTNYCLNCKKVYLGHMKCPLKHSIVIKENKQELILQGISRVCDFCFRDVQSVPGAYYQDLQCDLDFCCQCFQQMI